MPVIKPEPAPKRKPKPKPAAAPISAPGRTPVSSPIAGGGQAQLPTYFVYELPLYQENHHIHPKHWGEKVGEFVSEAEAKQHLRDHGLDGDYVVSERHGGQIGTAWHINIEPTPGAAILADEAESDDELWLSEDDDEPDAITPEEMRLRLRLAKLEAQQEAQQRPLGQAPSLLESLQALKVLDEMRGERQPQKSLVEQVQEAKELLAAIAPRPNPTPTPATQPQELSTEQALLKLISEDPLTLSTVKERLLGSDEEEGGVVATIVKHFAPAVSQALPTLATALLAYVTGHSPQQQAGPEQTAAPAPLSTPHDAAQPMPPDVQAYNEVLALLLRTMQTGGDPAIVAGAIDGFVTSFPQYQALFDSLIQSPAGEVCALLAQAAPQAAGILQTPQAALWVTRLQACFAPEEPEEPGQQPAIASAQAG
jgi:hypothetical protein